VFGCIASAGDGDPYGARIAARSNHATDSAVRRETGIGRLRKWTGGRYGGFRSAAVAALRSESVRSVRVVGGRSGGVAASRGSLWVTCASSRVNRSHASAARGVTASGFWLGHSPSIVLLLRVGCLEATSSNPFQNGPILIARFISMPAL